MIDFLLSLFTMITINTMFNTHLLLYRDKLN